MDFNKFVIWLLRSPLHGLISRSMVVMHIQGVKSGKLYQVPVNYVTVQEETGTRLIVTSERQRTWWRNLRQETDLVLTYRGKQRRALAQAIEEQNAVAAGFGRYFRASPKSARYYGVELTPEGTVQESDLNQLALERVVVWIDLSE
jgi:hypothetical protein